MANLSIKDITQKTFKVTKKYVDTMVEAVDIAKQNKLIYEDDIEEFKRFTAEEAEVVISVDVGRICSVASLNLEIGKNYNVKTLVNTDIPKNISENLTKNVRTNGKMLIEFTATAVKDEEASQQLGQDIIRLEYNSDDCAYDIMIFDKIVLQVNEETNELDTIYSPDHATISIPFVSDYLEIGLKKLLKEELSNDFLKIYKFVTQEDKDNWNNKQDKIKNGVFIKQTPPPDTYGYNKFNLVLNILENGLYIATNEISFYDETTLLENGAELSNGKKECSFHIYEGHLFRYTKIEYSTEYCYIENLTTGITCCLDVEGCITGIYANNGFMYLDDIEKVLQLKADKSELFSGDYNDLENRPCYDTRELIELTYDGDVTGKVIATEPLESMVKVSDEVVDYETYIKSVVGIYHPDNGIQYHNMSDKIEGEDYFLTKSKKIIWGGNVTVVYEDNATVMGATFPEKGIYFRNSSLLIDYGDPSYVCFFSAVMEEGEIKQLDEKFIPDSIATKEYVNNAVSEHGLMDFPGIRSAGNMTVKAEDLKAGGWYKVPDKIEDKNLPNAIFIQKVDADGNPHNWSIFNNGDLTDRTAIFYVASNSDTKTVLIRYGAVATKIDIDWTASTRTITLVNNIYEFEPTDDYNFVSKKYVDDNKDFIHLTGTTENPIILTDLELGRYLIDGPVKFHPGLNAANVQNKDNYQVTIGMKTATAIRGTVMVNGLLSRFHYNYSTQEWFKSDFVTRSEVLSLTNYEEYTPTENYHPATKKYVDDNNHVKYLTDAYGTASAWKVDVNSMEAGFDYKFPPNATKAVAISYRFINSEQKTETKNLVVFTQNTGKIPVIHMYEKVVDSKYVIMVGHELKVQLDVVDNGDGTKSVTVTGTPLTLSASNEKEYTPTGNYHPATKKYVDDAINTNSIVRPYEVFRVDETVFGKTGYIDVETMEPSVKYGLTEEYLDCNSFAFVVPTETTPYAVVCIASSFQVSDLMVTEKWEGDPSKGEEGLYIIVKGLNVDYKINIRHKESKDGITIETIRNTRYLDINNTKEFIPTGDYNPATKKYVDENKGLNHITGTEENPIVLTDLDIGTYEIDGKLKTYPDSTSLKTVYNGLIVVERKDASISKGIYSYNGLIYSFTYTVSANVFIENKFVKDEEVLTRTNTLDFAPTADYHPVTKKYVDEAIANASLGNGSDVSDSGVIEDSEFDDLISGTFGPEYVNKDE